MGSYTSRHNTNIVQKPLEVLPATESWSTLDAFQATVKKDEHHELINRSKTQKSLLIKRNSFLTNNYKRRTKTLNVLPANLPPSEQQPRANKKPVTIRAKTQATLSPTRSTSGEEDSIHPLPSQFSESRLNARRPTHFYEVRQAMVNRKSLKKLESIASMSVSHFEDQNVMKSSPNLKIKTNSERASAHKLAVASNPALNSIANEPVEVGHSTNKPVLISIPTEAENLAIEQPDVAEHLMVVASPSAVKLENKTQEASLSAVQLETKADASQSGLMPSSEISHNTFKVDPVPHTTFAPDSQPSELELQCQATVAELTLLSSEESTRKEVEELLQQWEESGQLAGIEAHALRIPQSQTTTITELASSLVDSDASYTKAIEGNELHIQVAQAYCIYTWIANNITYDVEQWKAYHSGSGDESNLLSSTEAEEVLDARVTVCSGYANLFKALALTAGLEAETLHGHAKQWKCLSEEKPDVDIPFKPSRENAHTWNSVMVGGVPHLLDCTFASGYVTSSTNFCKSFNRHYFTVPPQQMVLTHWPSDDSRQLLKEPLTLEKFQPLIPLSSSTKWLGIEPECWSEVIEILDDPVACIRLRCKDSVSVLASLIASNDIRNYDISTPSNQEKFTFSYREGNVVHIRAAPPQKGPFFLNIYACESLENESSQSYRLVLSYLIQNKREIVNQVGYPLVNRAEASTSNFKLLYWNAPNSDYCCENSGQLEVVFRARPDLQFYHCIVPSEVVNGSPIQANETYHFNTLVVQNEDGDPSLYSLRTIFPTQGWWTLNLYAKKPGNDTNFESPQKGYSLVVTYNVYVQIGVPEQSYPNMLSPYISMLQPEPIFASGDELFSFYFNSSKTFDFHSYLTFDQQTGESMDSFTAIESVTGSSQCKLSTIFSKPGRWYVHVFGKDINDPLQKSYSGLFVLQVKVNSSLKNTMFPKLNQPLAAALNVHYLNSGSIIFQDNGSPFVYQILVPKGGSTDLIHSIKPHNTGDTAFSEDLLQHCTSLSFSSCTDDSKHSTVCTLKAVFPWAGMWTVQVFAASTGSKRYVSLIEVNLQVNNPTPDVCFIKIQPFFHHLNLNIPERFLSYNPTMDASEIEVPFKAPDSVQFVWNMEFVKSGEKFFQQAIIHSQEESLNQDSDCNRILHVIFPKPGEWTFHLYGRTSSTEQEQKHNYQSVMEFRIKVSSFNNEVGFPHIFDPFQSVFGMKLEKEKLPLITKITSLPSKVIIPFYSPPNVKLWHDIEVDNSSNTQPSAQLNHDSDGGHHELTVEVDRKGKWTVILYAQLTKAEKKNWTAIIKHTISSE